MTALVLALCVASSLLTTVWHHWVHRAREIRSHRAMCNHVWGEVKEVGPNGPRIGGRMFFRNCLACSEQMHCNEDGSLYVPRP